MSKADKHTGTIIKTKLKNGKISYRCRIYVGDENQKFISASAPKQEIARQKAAAKYKLYQRRKKNESVDSKEQAAKTVEASLNDFLDNQYSSRDWKRSTYLARKSEVGALSGYIGKKTVAELSASTCNTCLAKMLKDYNRSTVKKCHDLLKQYVNYLFVNDVIIEDFSNNIQSILVRKDNSNDEAEHLIFDTPEYDAIKDLALCEKVSMFEKAKVQNLQYKALIMYIALLTGMRIGELRALKLNKINYKEHYININKAYSRIEHGEDLLDPKTKNSSRKIGINSHVEKCLSLAASLRPSDKTDFLCITSLGTSVTDRTFLKWFNAVLNEAGIEKNGRSPRALRHTFISLSMDNDKRSPLWNKSISFISKYVGHSKTSTTTDIYTQVKGSAIQKVKDDNKKELEVLELSFDDD